MILGDEGGHYFSNVYSRNSSCLLVLLQNSNYTPVKGYKMSNNNQVNSDRLACTINTADNGSNFSKDGNLVWHRFNLGHRKF